MKKIYQIVLAMTCVSVLASSCIQQLIDPSEPSDAVRMTFTARFADAGEATKTQLDNEGVGILWNVEDSINVFSRGNNGQFFSTNAEPASIADFAGHLTTVTGSLNAGAGENWFWAVYPYSLSNTSNGSSVTTVLPNIQKAVPGSFDPYAFPTVARSGNFSLAFYNVGGGVKFSVQREGIRQVILRGNSGETLAGTITVQMDKDGHPEVTQVDNARDFIQLNAPAGETFEVGRWYYLVCLPVEFTEGFTMEFRGNRQRGVYAHPEAVSVKRSVWGQLMNVDEGVDFEDVDIEEYQNMSASATANSYIVSTPGLYRLNATVAGNGQAGLFVNDAFPATADLDPDSVDLLWCSPDLKLVDVLYDGGYAMFEYLSGKGNAVIAARKGSDIIWSWHIWATDQPELMEYDGIQWMDRNLGAVSAAEKNGPAEMGLLYQWGRKDPFIPDTESITFETVLEADILQAWLQHPDKFLYMQKYYFGAEDFLYLWGNPDASLGGQGIKTIYDPCPAGYTVPDYYWTDGKDNYSEADWYVVADRGFVLGETLWLPASVQVQYPFFDGFSNEQYALYWTDNEQTGMRFSQSAGNAYLYKTPEGGYVRCIKEEQRESSKPTVETLPAVDIRNDAMTVEGQILSNGNARITSYGIRWGLTEALENIAQYDRAGSYISVPLTDLPESTTVYYQMFATNSQGTAYGQILTANTLSRTAAAQADLNEAYKLMYDWGWAVTGNTHQSFGILSSTLAAEVMGDDFVMKAQGNGWFWYDCTYNVKSKYDKTTWRSQDLWVQYYTFIEKANSAIGLLANADGADKNSLLGQAHAIRAYSYFMLAQWFSRTYVGHETDPCVPLFLTHDESVAPNKPRATVLDVYSAIKNDINQACRLLEGSAKHQDPKVIDKYVANAIKAKVLLETGDYQGAYDAAAIAVQGASIDFDAAFKFNDATHASVLWGADVPREDGTTNPQFLAHMDPLYGGYGYWSRKCLGDWLYARINAADARRDAWWNYETLTDGVSLGYQQYKFLFADPDDPYDGADKIYIRAAEMQLIMAEAACRLGNETTARSLLNALMKTRNPEYDCSAKTGKALGALTTTETGSLLEEIILQRRIELWGESGRIFDIKRLKQGFDRSLAGGWPTGALLSDKNTTDPESYDWVMTIPKSAFDANPSMDETADQNPM